MTQSNAPTAASLDTMTEADLVELPAVLLASIQGEVDGDLALAKKRRSVLDAVLHRKYGDKTTAERDKVGKDSGVVRFADGGCVIVADGKKTVSWDQEKLGELRDTIVAAGDDPSVYMTPETEFKVKEAAYKTWSAPIRAAFEPLRTVKVAPKYEIKSGDGDDR